jgi:hypothetical protein
VFCSDCIVGDFGNGASDVWWCFVFVKGVDVGANQVRKSKREVLRREKRWRRDSDFIPSFPILPKSYNREFEFCCRRVGRGI